MCGICGIVALNSSQLVDNAALLKMTESIHRRGPDDQGIYNNGLVGLGSRRLAIIDVGGGHQPITNETETIWIVFNGEIYNYRELAIYLQKR